MTTKRFVLTGVLPWKKVGLLRWLPFVSFQAHQNTRTLPDLVAYPSYEKEQTFNRISSWMGRLETDLASGQRPRPSHLSARAWNRALFRRIHKQYVDAFHFATMISWVLPNQARLYLAAPKKVRQGIPSVSETGSRILWCVTELLLLIDGLVLLGKTWLAFSLQMVRRSPNVQIERPVIWIGLSPAEVTDDADGLNALEFARAKRVAVFQSDAPLIVQAPWRSPVYGPEASFLSDALKDACAPPLSWSYFSEWSGDCLRVAALLIHLYGNEDGLGLLLARDVVQLPLYRRCLDQVRPRGVVTSNAMHLDHPLWFPLAQEAGCETTMLFFSTNCSPLLARQHTIGWVDQPSYRWSEYSRYEVWTDGQARWLESIGVSREAIHIAGPIIFASYTPRSSSARGDTTTAIGVFDVTPFSGDFWIPRGSPGDHYYCFEELRQFMNDLQGVCEETFGKTGYTLLLKSKRTKRPGNDPRYFDLLDELAHDPAVRLVNPSMNPLLAVTLCDAVVSVPFSSPSILAADAGIPGIYYDARGSLKQPAIPTDRRVPLVQGKEGLRAWLRTALPRAQAISA